MGWDDYQRTGQGQFQHVDGDGADAPQRPLRRRSGPLPPWVLVF